MIYHPRYDPKFLYSRLCYVGEIIFQILMRWCCVVRLDDTFLIRYKVPVSSSRGLDPAKGLFRQIATLETGSHHIVTIPKTLGNNSFLPKEKGPTLLGTEYGRGTQREWRVNGGDERGGVSEWWVVIPGNLSTSSRVSGSSCRANVLGPRRGKIDQAGSDRERTDDDRDGRTET